MAGRSLASESIFDRITIAVGVCAARHQRYGKRNCHGSTAIPGWFLLWINHCNLPGSDIRLLFSMGPAGLRPNIPGLGICRAGRTLERGINLRPARRLWTGNGNRRRDRNIVSLLCWHFQTW